MRVIPSHCCKETPISSLHTEKIAEEVLLCIDTTQAHLILDYVMLFLDVVPQLGDISSSAVDLHLAQEAGEEVCHAGGARRDWPCVVGKTSIMDKGSDNRQQTFVAHKKNGKVIFFLSLFYSNWHYPLKDNRCFVCLSVCLLVFFSVKFTITAWIKKG